MQQHILDRLIQLAQADSQVEVLWLYGSRAKGTATLESDYDLAVAFRSFPKDLWERRLQPELLAQKWADRLAVEDRMISVIDINHVPLPLAYAVISTGQVLWANSKLRQIKEENRIFSMWELDYLYSQKIYG